MLEHFEKNYVITLDGKPTEGFDNHTEAMAKFARVVVHSSSTTFYDVTLIDTREDEGSYPLALYKPERIDMIAQVFGLPTEKLIIGHNPQLFKFRAVNPSHAEYLIRTAFPGRPFHITVLSSIQTLTQE